MSAHGAIDPIYLQPSLEELLSQDFGLETPTALQRAVARIADGRPLGELRAHPHVVAAIGPLPRARCIPASILLLSGIRTGKSLLASAAAVRCALTADMSGFGPGDIPRATVVSLRKENADVIMEHLRGALANSARLRSVCIDDKRADRVRLRHPSGRPVDIVVDVGSRAGASLRSRWNFAVIFDEAAHMVGSGEGVVNLDDQRAAVAGRLRPGLCAREWMIGSPWAPFGPAYELARDRWKKADKDLFVIRSRADWLNPVWWTRERYEDLERTNPDAYRTEFLAEFQDAEEALLTTEDVEACVRQGPAVLEPEKGHTYAAEIDPAMRTNAFTLVIVGQRDKKHFVALAKEWRPASKGKSLDFLAVLREVQELCAPYGITQVGTDQFQIQALASLGSAIGLGIVEYAATTMTNAEGYMNLRTRVQAREVELPNDPVLLTDLKRLVRRVTQVTLSVQLPTTADGRHADFAPCIMRAVQRYCKQPGPADLRSDAQKDQERMTKAWMAKHAKDPKIQWWLRKP
jgi:hypothetical protein